MSEKQFDGAHPDSQQVKLLRRKHDDFVKLHACRLGCQPADILQSVRDYGLTACDIAELADKSGLHRYATGGGMVGLTIIGFKPVQQVHVTNHRGRR